MFSVELFTRLDFSLLKEAATTKVFPLMFIFVLTVKVFPLERFAVYDVLMIILQVLLLFCLFFVERLKLHM